MSEAGQSFDLHLLAVARRLREDCARLAQSLSALRSASVEDVEEAFARHLRETATLQESIGTQVQALNARRRELEQLPEPQRGETLCCLAEARRLMQEAALAYGTLADDVSDVLSAIRQRLGGIRLGGRMLRTYRQAAR